MQTLETITGRLEPIGLDFFQNIPIWLRVVLSMLAIILFFVSMKKINYNDTVQIFCIVAVLRFVLCAIYAISPIMYLQLANMFIILLMVIFLGYRNKSAVVGFTMALDTVIVSEVFLCAIEWLGLKIMYYIVQLVSN